MVYKFSTVCTVLDVHNNTSDMMVCEIWNLYVERIGWGLNFAQAKGLHICSSDKGCQNNKTEFASVGNTEIARKLLATGIMEIVSAVLQHECCFPQRLY